MTHSNAHRPTPRCPSSSFSSSSSSPSSRLGSRMQEKPCQRGKAPRVKAVRATHTYIYIMHLVRLSLPRAAGRLGGLPHPPGPCCLSPPHMPDTFSPRPLTHLPSTCRMAPGVGQSSSRASEAGSPQLGSPAAPCQGQTNHVSQIDCQQAKPQTYHRGQDHLTM